MMNIPLDGAACHIATAGHDFDATRPTLILIHGAANDHAAWHDMMPMLAAGRCNVVAPDLPGHGLSGGAPLTSVGALADWVLNLVGALGLKSAALAGHSMGSLIALEAAARGGNIVERLALLGSSVPMPVAGPLLDAARTQPDSACRMIVDWSHTPGFSLASPGGGHGVWGPGKTLAVMRRNAHTLATDLTNCNDYTAGLAAATRVTCPSLLILGKRDRMTPLRNVQPLADALTRVSRCEIADCGHAMMVEKPREVSAALLQFIAD